MPAADVAENAFDATLSPPLMTDASRLRDDAVQLSAAG